MCSTFSGKERDEETGYSYFGARHYNSDLSIWLSADPMSDKYPGLSPYTYCGNNPVRLVDPDGRKIRFASGCSKEFKEQFRQAIQHLKTHKVDGVAARLEKSSVTYYISEQTSGTGSYYDAISKTIYWCPTEGLLCNETGVVLSPTTVLNHELGHAENEDKAGTSQKLNEYSQTIIEGSSDQYGTIDEEIVITGVEQRTAKALGEIQEGQVTRTDHGGQLVTTESVTSNKIIKNKVEDTTGQ